MYQSLSNIQQSLKCNKSQYNSFGQYHYRSCEDILEAVKPLLAENECVLTLSDDIVAVGDRIYVKATAILTKGDQEIGVTAYAREEEKKKGMDGAQITGSASSYARKYALNGLFCIDDTKDADYNNQMFDDAKGDKKKDEPKDETVYLSDYQKKIINDYPAKTKDWIKKHYKIGSIDLLTKKQASDVIKQIKKQQDQQEKAYEAELAAEAQQAFEGV